MRDHWETVYHDKSATGVSWYQAEPRTSLDLIDGLGTDPHTPILDAGGGASSLAARLVARGYADVTVVDFAGAALAMARRAMGDDRNAVTWIAADLLTWRPPRQYGLWHDRAVFHFLTDPADRATYLATVRSALAPGAALVFGTFAAEGPTRCSGLPVVRYSPDELAAELKEAFGGALSVTGHRAEQHHTPAGTPQPFTWLTARLR